MTTPISRSTISENPIGVESIRRPDADLQIEVFSEVSVSRRAIVDTAELSLGIGINVFSYGELAVIPLELVVEEKIGYIIRDTVFIDLKFEDVITQSINIDVPLDLTIKSFDDNRIVDPPSEGWRDRPGLPLQPIGYSPIAVEQFDITFRSFSDVSDAVYEITASDEIQIVLNSIDDAPIEFGDQDTFSIRSEIVSQGDLGKFAFDTREITLNSFTTGLLDIGATDDIQQRFNYYDTVFAGNTVAFDQTSIAYFDYGLVNWGVIANSFARSYTIAVQEGSDDLVPLTLAVDSDEIYRPLPEEEVELPPPVQIWIG
jgi:hypothetical protein